MLINWHVLIPGIQSTEWLTECCKKCCQVSQWIMKKTMPDFWCRKKRIDPSYSAVAAEEKPREKVITANLVVACRPASSTPVKGGRYERRWCYVRGRGDATFRDFLRWEARKLGHCGRHTAPMQPAMIIRHFSDWATCPSSTGFLHAQNIDLGRSWFRNPNIRYWTDQRNTL